LSSSNSGGIRQKVIEFLPAERLLIHPFSFILGPAVAQRSTTCRAEALRRRINAPSLPTRLEPQANPLLFREKKSG
jgi:hypothetical protein